MIKILKVTAEKGNLAVSVKDNFEDTNWEERDRRLVYRSDASGVTFEVGKGRGLRSNKTSIFDKDVNKILLYMGKTDTAIVEKNNRTEEEVGKPLQDEMLFLDMELKDFISVSYFKNNNPLMAACKVCSTLPNAEIKAYPGAFKVCNKGIPKITLHLDSPQEKKLYAVDIELIKDEKGELKGNVDINLLRGEGSDSEYLEKQLRPFLMRTSKSMLKHRMNKKSRENDKTSSDVKDTQPTPQV